MTTGELSGRVAAVTGGSGGIGTAILARLQQAGAIACSLDPAAAPEPMSWLQTDVTSEASIAAALNELERRQGRLDFVVHAAGVSYDAVVWKTPAAEWDRVHAVNLRGAFLLIHHAVPRLRRAGGGRIVLIGSINGTRGKAGTAAYSASKAGLVGLARTVARETGRFGIRVNVIEPGWVRTPLTENLSPELTDAAVRETLLGTLAHPDDIARGVTYLCGPGGNAITGQVLRIDSGQLLGG